MSSLSEFSYGQPVRQKSTGERFTYLRKKCCGYAQVKILKPNFVMRKNVKLEDLEPVEEGK